MKKMFEGKKVISYYLSHNPVIGLLGPIGCVASIAFIIALIATVRTSKHKKPTSAIIGIAASLVSLVTVLIWRYGWIASTNGEFFYEETFIITQIAAIVIAVLSLVFCIVCVAKGKIRSITSDEFSTLGICTIVIACLVSPMFLGVKAVIIALICSVPFFFLLEMEGKKNKKDGADKKSNPSAGARFIGALAVVGICFAIGMGVRLISTGGPAHSRTLTCSVCQKSYEAGDAGGNYMSIARSGMCVSCHNSFQGAKDALEQNGINVGK